MHVNASLPVSHGPGHGLGSAKSLLARGILVAKIGDGALVGRELLDDERELLINVIADEKLAPVVRDDAVKVLGLLARCVGIRPGKDPDIFRVDVRVDARPFELGLELSEDGLRMLGVGKHDVWLADVIEWVDGLK